MKISNFLGVHGKDAKLQKYPDATGEIANLSGSYDSDHNSCRLESAEFDFHMDWLVIHALIGARMKCSFGDTILLSISCVHQTCIEFITCNKCIKRADLNECSQHVWSLIERK